MNTTSYMKPVKTENSSLELNLNLPPTSQQGTAFDTYINTDFVDEHGCSTPLSIPLPTSETMIQNQAFMNFFINDMFSPTIHFNHNLNQASQNLNENCYFNGETYLQAYNEAMPLNQQGNYNMENNNNSNNNDTPHHNNNSNLEPVTNHYHTNTNNNSIINNSLHPPKKAKTTNLNSKPRKKYEFNPTQSKQNQLENNSNSRVELVLSPEDLELIEKAGPKERRQIRNKISARNFRLRRKEYINGLEEKAKEYTTHTEALQKEVYIFQNENLKLKNVIEELKQKFNLLTIQIPELSKFSGLDFLTEVSISEEGKLIAKSSSSDMEICSSPSITSQTTDISCRNISELNSNNSKETTENKNLVKLFSSPRSRPFLVKA